MSNLSRFLWVIEMLLGLLKGQLGSIVLGATPFEILGLPFIEALIPHMVKLIA